MIWSPPCNKSFGGLDQQSTPEAKDTSPQLTGQMEAIVHEMQQSQPDKAHIEQRLDQATGSLNKLVGMADAAMKLGPTLAGLGTAFETISRLDHGGITREFRSSLDARGSPTHAGERPTG